jgi:tetratricopeptide (TPR) repeat protein
LNVDKKAKVLLEEKKVITFWELLGIVVLFLGILYILFPKGTLEKYVLSETKNYELAVKYLETLTKAYPDLKEFQIVLLRFYIKSGNLEKAAQKLEQLEINYKNDFEFNLTAYNLYKNFYFKTKNKIYLEKAKLYLTKILKISPNLKTYEFAYKESTQMSFQDIRFKILKKLINLKPSKEYLLELYNLSIYYKDYKTAEYALNKLYQMDKNYKWLEKKAELYLYVKKDINKAVDIYLQLFKITKKSKYFLKSFYLLIWNKKYNEALKLAKAYENYFLYTKDKTVLKRILKFYLERGKLNYARDLSLKILKMEES